MGEQEAKPVAGSEPGEGSQRIADANGPSRCGEVLDLPHPPTASIQQRRVFAPQRQVEARGDGPDFPDEHECLWLLGLATAPAEDMADNPSGRPGKRLALVKAFS